MSTTTGELCLGGVVSATMTAAHSKIIPGNDALNLKSPEAAASIPSHEKISVPLSGSAGNRGDVTSWRHRFPYRHSFAAFAAHCHRAPSPAYHRARTTILAPATPRGLCACATVCAAAGVLRAAARRVCGALRLLLPRASAGLEPTRARRASSVARAARAALTGAAAGEFNRRKHGSETLVPALLFCRAAKE